MPLDPQVQALLDQMAALDGPPIHTLTPELVRMGIKMQLAGSPVADLPGDGFHL